MNLSITCTHSPTIPDARVLGYLLHKHPDRWFSKAVSFGTVSVFYPESTAERSTVAMSVAIDPVSLVRRGTKNTPTAISDYVSDRPYSPSSFLSVALAECFGTALSGRCDKFPEAVEQPLHLTASVPAISCSAGENAIRSVFEPLGYTVDIQSTPELLDGRFPEWGPANQFTVTITGEVPLRNLLSHLYVLIPVLDNAKHYFIADEEVEKLLRRGEGWLGSHPAREWITQRYLQYRQTLTDEALLRLAQVDELPVTPDSGYPPIDDTPKAEAKLRLNDQRVQTAMDLVLSVSNRPVSVIDLGCGEGKTLAAIHARFPSLQKLTGLDVSSIVLKRAQRRLRWDGLEGDKRDRLSLLLGSLVYRDTRLRNYDIGLLMEVIEHVDKERLSSLEDAVFGYAHPKIVFVTTPNADYNPVWQSLPGGALRHSDHRFEMTREQFNSWCQNIGHIYGYQFTLAGIGEEDPEGRGQPTQYAVFRST